MLPMCTLPINRQARTLFLSSEFQLIVVVHKCPQCCYYYSQSGLVLPVTTPTVQALREHETLKIPKVKTFNVLFARESVLIIGLTGTCNYISSDQTHREIHMRAITLFWLIRDWDTPEVWTPTLQPPWEHNEAQLVSPQTVKSLWNHKFMNLLLST